MHLQKHKIRFCSPVDPNSECWFRSTRNVYSILYCARQNTHDFLLLILTEGMNVVLPNPIFLSGFGGGRGICRAERVVLHTIHWNYYIISFSVVCVKKRYHVLRRNYEPSSKRCTNYGYWAVKSANSNGGQAGQKISLHDIIIS
jgi:hypothetical protein